MLEKKDTYNLGCRAEDIITEFQGIITGFCRYITGCDQYLITPKVDKEGKPVSAKWFDENRIEILDYEPIVINTGMSEEAPIK